MINYERGGSRLNRYTYPQWISAFILCLCILLTGHFWPAAEALQGDIMPITSFTGVYEVTLTGPNGYSQTVDIQGYYQGDNSPITFELASQSFDDNDIDSVAAILAEEIKSQYQFSVTMDYYAGGNTQYLNISDVTSEQITLIDGSGTAHWAIRFELHFSDQFTWRDTSFNNTVYVQVLGDEKELAPGEIPDTPAQNYTAIKRWFPADSPRTGEDWQRTEDTRYDNWEGLDYNSGYDNSGTVLWGKQVTEDSDLEAWNLFTSDPENYQDVEDYLNQTYRYLGVFTNWYYEYPAVQWAYDSSLSGTVEVDGIPEVRYAFKVVTNDTFTTDGNNELGTNASHSVSFYLYFIIPPEGLEGVTDWIPGTTSTGSNWIESGKEEKEITEERDSAALAQWETLKNTDDFAAWLNNEANGYTQLIVNTNESGWSSEPYTVTWKFDHETIDVANDLKYYYFKADTGATVFYGENGLFGGKSDKTPLKFYLYFSEEYVKPPETIYGVYGWQVLDPDGGNCGEITTNTVLPDGVDRLSDGTYFYPTEYIHLSADTTFQNFDDLTSDAFKEEMDQYIADNFYKDGKISYTLKVGDNDKTETWDVVPIKSISFDLEKTLTENTDANRNYDANRIVAMFKVEVVDSYYWGGNANGTPVVFYISVTEAAVTRNPVTDEDVIADHVVNDENYPNTFGGPIIEQPKGVTVNLFDYWLEGTETEPGSYDENDNFISGTGNLDTAPFYNWTPYNVKWETGRSENVFQSGINVGHLLLFGGGNRFRGWQADAGDPNIVGKWNFYTGDPDALTSDGGGNMSGGGGPNYDIVQNTLGEDGYPALNLNSEKWEAYDEYGNFNSRTAPWSYFGASSYYNGSSWYVDRFGKASLYRKGTNDASNTGGKSDFAGDGYDYFNPTQSSASSEHFTAISSDKLTESLGYLFDPSANTAYRTVYEDVRGMFRLDQAGYYYFNAPEDLFDFSASDGAAEEENTTLEKGRTNVYAELNTEQKTDDEGKSYYEMTLYDKAYGTQFFPFDEWAKSFEYDEATGEVKANRFEPDQYDVTDNDISVQVIDSYANNLNHFFGMTLDAVFQQPLNGLVNGEDMVFQFSGDDDVWIYIDGILVGDLGGVHSKSSIEIDYATGVIRIQDRRWKDLKWDELSEDIQNALKNIKITEDIRWHEYKLYELFAEADDSLPSLSDIQSGAASLPKGWEMAENGNPIFATNTLHELKFFYMERGHEESNLSLSYNFPETNPDRIQKVDQDGNSLSDKATFAIYKAYRKGDNGEKDLELSNELIDADDFTHLYSEFTYEKEVGEEGDPDYQKNDLILKDITDLLELNYAELGEETVLGTIPLAYSTYDTKFFILEETVTPTGYRTNTPIVLQYDSASNTLVVINRYETGAYTSYLAQWTGKVFTSEDTTIPFMRYQLTEGSNRPFVEDSTTGEVNRDDLASGLTIVIPIIKQTDENDKVQWYPMYGSNTYGWHTIDPGGSDHDSFVQALTIAFVMQITVDATNTRDWYLTWNDYYQRLEGFMENLPGNATRFLNYNPDGGDMSLVPLYIPKDILEYLVGDELDDDIDDDERFALLKGVLQNHLREMLDKDIADIKSEEDLKKALEILTEYVTDVNEELDKNGIKREHILDNSSASFNRQPRTIFYIPNEQRELRVRKIDPDGNYVNGVVFAIFESVEAAAEFPGNSEYDSAEAAMEALAEKLGEGVASYGQTANAQINETLIQPGTLVFREDASDYDYNDGFSPIDWPSSRTDAENSDETLPAVLWLKEIYAPAGYALNNYLVRIEVGNTAIYANATGYDADGNILQPKSGEDSVKDGITVRAALGKLAQTLVKYAMGNNVDVTLQDISITKQTQTGGDNGALISNGWSNATGDDAGSYNLHYGINAEELTGQYGRHSSDADLPIFVAEDGYIRVMPHQADVHDDSVNTRRDDLTGINLDNLFGLLNVVVIEDDRIEAAMEISKKVEGDAPDDDIYQFNIKLTPPEGETADELKGIYEAYIHETGHLLPVLDEDGKQVEVGGVPQYSGPCAPADMNATGHTKLYLYVDESGEAWVMADHNSDPPTAQGNLSRLTLKDDQTYVILGLPEGTGFTVTEAITTTSGGDSETDYDTTINVADHLAGNAKITDSERSVSGMLNSSDPDDPVAEIPSVKVKFNNIVTISDPDPDPSSGKLKIEKTIYRVTSDLLSDTFTFKVTIILPASYNDAEKDGLPAAFNYTGYVIEDVELYGDVTKPENGELHIDTSSWKKNADGRWVGSGTVTFSHGQGILITDLPFDTDYEVTEIEPTGYRLRSSEETEGTINISSSVPTAMFVNEKLLDLPSTGGTNTAWYALFGGILLLSGLTYLFVLSRRRWSADV